MRANVVKNMIETGLGDINKLTIGEALMLKIIFGLSNSEATDVFLGGMKHENV